MQGGRIYVRLKLPEALQIEEYFISAIGSIYPDRPVGGSYLVANGSFRSDTQAGSSLAFLMEDFSGILTYSKIRFRRVFRSGRLRPKSQAMLGGSYYLFADDQHFIKDRIWYDADFREDFWQDCRYSFTDLGKADGFIRNLIRSFDKSTSSKVLWSSFRVASRAWMSHDPNDRLAQLWSAFEILFSRSDRKTDSYDTIVKRASFFARDRRLVRLILSQAADARNQFLHRRSSAPNVSHLTEWLTNYYAGTIEWIAFSRINVESHD
jgi:hypothetical protein